jgi:hypothetical protein
MSTLYIKVEDEVPVGHPMLADTVRGLLETSTLLEGFAKENGYYPFENIDVPETYDVSSAEGYELCVDGVVRPKLTLRELSAEEKRTRFIRPNRDRLLAISDWTQIPDAPLTTEKKAEWAAYRQELRNLPATFSDAVYPNEVIWPESPA